MYTLDPNSGIVTRDSDGVQVAPAQSADDPLFVEYNAWVNEGNSPTMLPQIIIIEKQVSKLDFMNRFHDDELAMIYTVAKQNIAVEIWLEKFKLSEFVNLNDERTIAGIQALEAFGLIGAGRAAEILA